MQRKVLAVQLMERKLVALEILQPQAFSQLNLLVVMVMVVQFLPIMMTMRNYYDHTVYTEKAVINTIMSGLVLIVV